MKKYLNYIIKLLTNDWNFCIFASSLYDDARHYFFNLII